jgi:hypothetical protein
VTTLIVIIVVVVVLVAGAAFLMPRLRRQQLQRQFGPEYERTVDKAGDRRTAERDLQQRTQERKELEIRPLDPGARAAYAQRWRTAQERFVDTPTQAVGDADALVEEVMRERGYPVGDFERQARAVSVDHADVVSEYHAAHDISERTRRGEASTEQLREAMVHYRTLFAELLDDDGGGTEGRTDARNQRA